MLDDALEYAAADRDARDALEVARTLVGFGVPIFVAHPAVGDDGIWNPAGGHNGCGFWLPSGWQGSVPSLPVVDTWRPGMALCAVMGHGLDLLDVDDRNGGRETRTGLLAAGMWPRAYAEADTPSGGSHAFVAGLGVRSRDAVRPGLDVKAGDTAGAGRGFAFIAPTVKLSKTTGEIAAYRWTTVPDEGILAESHDDNTGGEVAELVRRAHGSSKAQSSAPGAATDPDEARDWLVAEPIPVGSRYPWLRSYAGWLRHNDTRLAEALVLMRTRWQACQQPASYPIPWADAETLLRDVYARYTPRAADLLAVIAEPDDPDATVDANASSTYTFTTGGTFILDTPADPEPLWGDGADVLLADGESLIIAGGQGLGKTTMMQQLALGRCGFGEYAQLLGYSIKPGAGRVLYLAMDRPRQAGRSFRRMVGAAWRDELDDRLVVWQGPPPADLARHTGLLLDLCRKADADTVVVDSLKDAAVGLSDDEVGAGYNRARQTAVTGGVQVVEGHHNRKALGGVKGGHPTIDDLYGSTWLPSGAGSVLLLTGAPGDPIVGLHHLKQPASEVGPLKMIHDHTTGRSTVWHATDLVQLAGAPGGISALDAARLLFDRADPTASDREKARRRLDKLTTSGLVRVVSEGNRTTNRATKWGSMTRFRPSRRPSRSLLAVSPSRPLHDLHTSPRLCRSDLHANLHGLHAPGTFTPGGLLVTPGCAPQPRGPNR